MQDGEDEVSTIYPIPGVNSPFTPSVLGETKAKVQRYNRRGGIENTYKKIKEFAAWTTSKAFEVRLFHFGFAVLLYNMWLLVDFLVQAAIYDEVRYKPRVTAGRFMTLSIAIGK